MQQTQRLCLAEASREIAGDMPSCEGLDGRDLSDEETRSSVSPGGLSPNVRKPWTSVGVSKKVPVE